MNKQQNKQRFSPEEWDAIKVHRYFLSRKFSRYIGIAEAVRSWVEDYALRWRGDRVKKAHLAQIDEIMKYKWIESEKAGCDLGREAVRDWIERYAGAWRREWERARR
ncbi:MAG: hypothetical protein U9N40_01455 [Euryarchaeota archaeon]|nr:hypothetical protein [Euryarchaeota archaeon]